MTTSHLFLSRLKQWLTSLIHRMLFGASHTTLTLPSTVTDDPYLLGFAGLTLGRNIVGHLSSLQHNNMRDQKMESVHQLHHPSPGVYTVRELVHLTVPLLDTIIHRLGLDLPSEQSAREVLIQGLAASLAPSGRESTLPLSYGPSDTSRKEVAWQVRRVGKSIVSFVHEASNNNNADANLHLRSQCEGHLWTPGVAALLLGPRSHGALLELYNEWLHRMILLRDALLCFENYQDVPLVIRPTSIPGLRSFEHDRKLFLLECLSGNIAHSAIVDLAKSFTAPGLPRGGYGLQYSQGVILPAFLSGSPYLHLLRYHPARIEDATTDLLFDYQYPLYRSLRYEISESQGDVPPGVWPPPSLMSLEPQVSKSQIDIDAGSDASRRILKLELVLDTDTNVTVDLGQITRGRRYAYRTRSKQVEEEDQDGPKVATEAPNTQASSNIQTKDLGTTLTPPPSADSTPASAVTPSPCLWNHLGNARIHRTAEILKQPGLLASSQNGQIHIFPASDPLVSLALLGKLYPENVILADETDKGPEAVVQTGKGFGARLLLWQEGRSTGTQRLTKS